MSGNNLKLNFMHYKIIFTIILCSLLVLGCETESTQDLTYTWMDEFSFDYPAGWQVGEGPEQTLILSETEPFPVDMLFIFTYLKMYPEISLEERLEQLYSSSAYKSVEVIDKRNIGDYTYTVVHLHSNYWDNNDTNFYLTEIDGSTLEYEVGISDNKIVSSVLGSLKKRD